MANESMALKNINVLTEDQFRGIPEEDLKRDELYLIPSTNITVNGVEPDTNGNIEVDNSSYTNRRVFESSGTFITPKTGVYTFMMMSGGQGGYKSGTDGSGAAGGTAGRFQIVSLYLPASSSCSITVGAGGARGGTYGGDSIVSVGGLSYSTAGGIISSPSNAAGVVGSACYFSGIAGGTVKGKGGGGSSGLQIYGYTGPTASPGTSGYGGNSNGGVGYGAGGAGGGDPSGGSYYGYGGAGAAGVVVVYY